jgi:hypothetical protein
MFVSPGGAAKPLSGGLIVVGLQLLPLLPETPFLIRVVMWQMKLLLFHLIMIFTKLAFQSHMGKGCIPPPPYIRLLFAFEF